MSWRAKRITDAIQEYDRELYAKDDGRAIRIYRKCWDAVKEQLTFEETVLNLVRNDHLVFSLTDTWGVNGKRVDWGIEPIMARLRALDLWNNRNLFQEFFEQEEKDERGRERHRKNTTEAFLSDFRSSFAKATDGINTSSLGKKLTTRLGEEKWLY